MHLGHSFTGVCHALERTVLTVRWPCLVRTLMCTQSVSLLHVPSTGEADLVRALASLFPGTTHPHALPNGKAQPAPTAPDAGPTAHANGTHAAANDGDSATAEAGKAANGEARPGGAKLVLGGAAAAAAAAPLEEVLLLGGASGELCVVRGGGGGVGKEEEEGGGLTVEQVLRSGGLSGDVAAWLLDRPAQRRRLLEGARVRAGARHGSFVQVRPFSSSHHYSVKCFPSLLLCCGGGRPGRVGGDCGCWGCQHGRRWRAAPSPSKCSAAC